jgi:hypothetical protein
MGGEGEGGRAKRGEVGADREAGVWRRVGGGGKGGGGGHGG